MSLYKSAFKNLLTYNLLVIWDGFICGTVNDWMLLKYK